MARSFAAGHVVSTSDTDTIATAIAISEPVPESLARVIALVDEIVLVDDDDLRHAQKLILETVGVAVEPAGQQASRHSPVTANASMLDEVRSSLRAPADPDRRSDLVAAIRSAKFAQSARAPFTTPTSRAS